MNKHIFYIAAACVALASCVKNEVRVNAPDKEITFQTVSTKAGAAFNTNHKFYSYAYFLEKGKNWDANHADAQAYIDNALIAYEPGAAPGKGYWAAANKYYWPKQGTLTFFAWTDDTADPSVGTGATASCTHDEGIKIENYSVKDNLNKDILVAEIAKDKTQNERVTEPGRDWTNGVPTVFRHALAKVEFKVNKKEAYPKVTFRVKSITLNKVSTKGIFTQYQSNPNPEKWGWNGWSEQEDLPVFTGDVEVTETAAGKFNELPLSATDYFIVLPQVFKGNVDTKLTIEYEIITYYVADDKPVTETVKETKNLDTIYPNNWECNKKYVLGITLGLNEIYWDPSVEAWDNGTVNGIEI